MHRPERLSIGGRAGDAVDKHQLTWARVVITPNKAVHGPDWCNAGGSDCELVVVDWVGVIVGGGSLLFSGGIIYISVPKSLLIALRAVSIKIIVVEGRLGGLRSNPAERHLTGVLELPDFATRDSGSTVLHGNSLNMNGEPFKRRIGGINVVRDSEVEPSNDKWQ